ncbi:OLC1v1017410C1 [Oldenlandia corymbosa var. corymbosa]|uniref:OLC1v1017410C1 n=1 Tax=Oldenlandia corymbosa var. corymbosa TaxID=529605 RepID=A0AAV1E9D9_OLDCO|nr:OLC1v1017410C1 [Oldenlandia corymbosa var. corymbosa]
MKGGKSKRMQTVKLKEKKNSIKGLFYCKDCAAVNWDEYDNVLEMTLKELKDHVNWHEANNQAAEEHAVEV